MNRIFLYIILILGFCLGMYPGISFAGSSITSLYTGETLNEIYTEGIGNNQFEAKVKALDKAMRRALAIIADKLIISDAALANVSIGELKEIFKDIKITRENSKAFLSGSRYSAIVEFSFFQSKLNDLIEKYCSAEINERFLASLVLPIFKINNKLFLNKDKQSWISSWQNSASILEENKMYCINLEDEKGHNITINNIFKLNYEDFLSMFPYKLFHNVLIPVAEYFTDRQTGASFLKVKYILITKDGNKENIVNYPIENTNSSSSAKITQKAILDAAKIYGKKASINKQLSNILNSDIAAKVAVPPEKFYQFILQVDYDGELEMIEQKLFKIQEVKRFETSIHYKFGNRVKVYTDLDIYDLSEKLYYNGLTYYYNNDRNPVIVNVSQ